MKILAIDDIEEITEFLQEMLEPDHDVSITTDPQHALELARTQQFDLVITDVGMPGLDGLTLAERIRTDSPALRILFLTGSHESPALALLPGVVAVLPKPLRWEQLKRTLASLTPDPTEPP